MLPTLRILVLAVMWSLVLIAFALFFVLASTDDGLASPPLWLVGAQVGAGVIVHLLNETIGYRVRAIAPGTHEAEARTQSGGAFRSALILRIALAEAIAVASLAAAFVVESGGFLGYVIGAVVSLALVGFHGWPWTRPIGKTLESLERNGARSYLREQLGLPTAPPGAIQEV